MGFNLGFKGLISWKVWCLFLLLWCSYGGMAEV